MKHPVVLLVALVRVVAVVCVVAVAAVVGVVPWDCKRNRDKFLRNKRAKPIMPI